MTAPATTTETAAGAAAATTVLPLPRLIVRLGGAGNRKFGRDTGIDVDPAELAGAARNACQSVLAHVAASLEKIHANDRHAGNVYPHVGNSIGHWLTKKLGWLFGQADRWDRHKRTGTPASVFSDAPPKIQVLTGDATGGDEIIRETALAMQGSVHVEHLRIAVEPPGNVTNGLGVGTIPEDTTSKKPLLSRAEADQRAREIHERAFGFRAQSEALRHHSDILLAIWDPDTEGKAGGTWESVQRALGEGVPVIAVRFIGIAHARIDILRNPEDADRPLVETAAEDANQWKDDLGKVLHELLGFPGKHWRHVPGHPQPTEHAAAKGHHKHSGSYHPRVAFATFREGGVLATPLIGRLWQPFDKVMKGKISVLRIPQELIRALLKRDQETPPVKAEPGTFGYHYEYPKNRASEMAGVFGDAYRGGIVASYSLAAAAVIFALIGHSCGEVESLKWVRVLFAVIELAAVILLLALAVVSRVENWHEAYTDSRILAEALRAMKYIAPLGVHTPLPKLPGFVEGEKSHSRKTLWSVWYFRALIREAPLRVPPSAATQLEKTRQSLLEDWIGPRSDTSKKDTTQNAHHEANVAGQRLLEMRVERLAFMVFIVVIAAAFFHLVIVSTLLAKLFPDLAKVPKDLHEVLFSIGVGGPALLAAFHGFLSQIEAARLCQRSEGMLARLQEHHRAIKALKLPDQPESAEAVWGLALEAIKVASLMMDEVAEWSLIYSKEIPLH